VGGGGTACWGESRGQGVGSLLLSLNCLISELDLLVKVQKYRECKDHGGMHKCAKVRERGMDGRMKQGGGDEEWGGCCFQLLNMHSDTASSLLYKHRTIPL
jgi:hypothetical protein